MSFEQLEPSPIRRRTNTLSKSNCRPIFHKLSEIVRDVHLHTLKVADNKVTVQDGRH